MNTDFNILWFEDNSTWYKSIKTDIEEYINSLCFNPKVSYFKSVYDENLEPTITEIDFDLIFADLNLNQDDKEKDKGSEAIKIIRSKNILADVLFYSTDGIDKIHQVMKSDVYEGVYTCIRDDVLLPAKAKELIDKVVKRSEDFLNIRGMMMDNVSEFDEKLKDVIKKRLSMADEDEIKALNEYTYEKVRKQLDTNCVKIDNIRGNFIIDAIDNSFLLDSYKLSMIVNKIFKDNYSTYEKMKNFHEKYYQDILLERNKLAHAKKEPEANGIFYFLDKNGVRTEYNSDKCKELREKINYYGSLLDDIFEEVK